MTMAPDSVGPAANSPTSSPVGAAPSLCWRVFVRDHLGRTWAPIVAAVDNAELRAKVATLYPESAFLEAWSLHEASIHLDFGAEARAARAAA